MSLRDDVVLRVVHQLVEALLRAAGLRRKKDLPAASEAVGDGLRGLGLSLDLLTRLDGPSLRGMIADPARRAMVAAALAELALGKRAEGDAATAESLEDAAADLVEDIDWAEVPMEIRDLFGLEEGEGEGGAEGGGEGEGNGAGEGEKEPAEAGSGADDSPGRPHARDEKMGW